MEKGKMLMLIRLGGLEGLGVRFFGYKPQWSKHLDT
jgi:hypothetical protein